MTTLARAERARKVPRTGESERRDTTACVSYEERRAVEGGPRWARTALGGSIYGVLSSRKPPPFLLSSTRPYSKVPTSKNEILSRWQVSATDAVLFVAPIVCAHFVLF